MAEAKERSRVTVDIERETRARLEAAAKRADRSLAAELRIAIREHDERLRRRKS